MQLVYVLNHSLNAAHFTRQLVKYIGQAHLLDGLSSEWDKRRAYRPAHIKRYNGKVA